MWLVSGWVSRKAACLLYGGRNKLPPFVSEDISSHDVLLQLLSQK